MKSKESRLEFFAWLFFGIGLLIIVIFVIRIFPQYSLKGEIDPISTAMVGTFIGGVASAFFTGATIILVYLTYTVNRDELKEINTANNKLIAQNNATNNFTNFRYLLDTLNEIHEKYKNKSHDYRKYNLFINSFDNSLTENAKIRLRSSPDENEVLNTFTDIIFNTKGKQLKKHGKEVKLFFDCLKLIISLLNDENKSIYLYKLKVIFQDKELIEAFSRYVFIDPEIRRINEEYGLIKISSKSHTHYSIASGNFNYNLSKIYERYFQ